jgi:hypothetical protein
MAPFNCTPISNKLFNPHHKLPFPKPHQLLIPIKTSAK